MPDRKLFPDLVGEQELFSCPPDTLVRIATQKMADRRVSAILVVGDDKQLLGLFTERDLAVRVVAACLDPDTTTLGEVMSCNPDHLPPEAGAMEALRLMQSRHYRHLPIVKDSKVLGIVSIRDLFEVQVEKLSRELQEHNDYISGSGYSVKHQVQRYPCA